MSEPGPEEGGEDIFLMPTSCTVCGDGRPLVLDGGFMKCPGCWTSYGAALDHSAGATRSQLVERLIRSSAFMYSLLVSSDLSKATLADCTVVRYELLEAANELHKLQWADEKCAGFLHVHGWDWEKVMEDYPGPPTKGGEED